MLTIVRWSGWIGFLAGSVLGKGCRPASRRSWPKTLRPVNGGRRTGKDLGLIRAPDRSPQVWAVPPAASAPAPPR